MTEKTCKTMTRAYRSYSKIQDRISVLNKQILEADEVQNISLLKSLEYELDILIGLIED